VIRRNRSRVPGPGSWKSFAIRVHASCFINARSLEAGIARPLNSQIEPAGNARL
jgi:hypothetical protein